MQLQENSVGGRRAFQAGEVSDTQLWGKERAAGFVAEWSAAVSLRWQRRLQGEASGLIVEGLAFQFQELKMHSGNRRKPWSMSIFLKF